MPGQCLEEPQQGTRACGGLSPDSAAPGISENVNWLGEGQQSQPPITWGLFTSACFSNPSYFEGLGKSYSRPGTNIKAVFRTRYFQYFSENIRKFFSLLHVSLNVLFFFPSYFEHMGPLGI